MTFIPLGGRRFAFGHPTVTATDVGDDALQGRETVPLDSADSGVARDVTSAAYAAHRSGVESPWPPGMEPPPAPVVDHVDLTSPLNSGPRTAPFTHRVGQIATTDAPGE